MASAWGSSWGQAWNGAWGSIDGSTPPPTPPAPPADTGVRPSGGFPSGDRGPTRRQKRRSRVLHGLEREIVEAVAARQVEALSLDEVQRQQELAGELHLRGIELETAHLEELSAEYERRIDEEIGLRLRRLIAQRTGILLLLLASVD